MSVRRHEWRGGAQGQAGSGRGGQGSGRGGQGSGQGAGRGGSQGNGRGGNQGSGQGRPPKQSARDTPVFLGSGIAPDASVTAYEDQMVNPNISGLTLADKTGDHKNLAFPPRPGYGKHGTPFALYANYFRLVVDKGMNFFKYAIKVTPINATPDSEIPRKKLRRIIQLFIYENLTHTASARVASDFAELLITTKALSNEDLSTKEITYRGDDEGPPPQGAAPNPRAKRFSVGLTPDLRNPLSASGMLDYLNNSNASNFRRQNDMKQVLNIILNHTPNSVSNEQVMSVGQRHFKLQSLNYQRPSLGSGLEALRGYYASVQLGARRLLLNVQVRNAAVKRPGPLVAVMREVGLADLEALESFLRGTRVEVNYEPAKKKDDASAGKTASTTKSGPKQTTSNLPRRRVRTICGLATRRDRVTRRPDESMQVQLNHPRFPHSPNKQKGFGPGEVHFYWRRERAEEPSKYITVKDYFQSEYTLTVDPQYPVVNVGTQADAVYMPVEVCKIIDGQTARTKLDPAQTQRMLDFAVRLPRTNAEDIERTGYESLSLTRNNSQLTSFGIEIPNRLLQVPARILPAPKVLYANDKSFAPVLAQWNMDKVKFKKTATVPKKWGAVVVQYRNYYTVRERDIHDAMLLLQDEMKKCGILVGQPAETISLPLDDANMRKEIDAMTEESVQEYGLVVWVLPKKAGTSKIYNEIKRAGEVVYGLQTICVVGSRFIQRKKNGGGPDVQYYANIALKVNLKFGGANQTLSSADLGVFNQQPTMLVGLDVTHPSPGSQKKAPSIAAMVASTDSSFAQFPGVLRVQTEAGQEMVHAHIAEMLGQCLRRFRKKSGTMPRSIVVFRDGVSEGQYSLVAQQEIPALEAAIKKHCQDVTVKLSVIICGKRHNTRFYPAKAMSSGQNPIPLIDSKTENPHPGTVVDRGITDPHSWDFYLQAHQSIKGTARPCHYFVLQNQIFKNADELEKVTHNFCYMYGRATLAVSYCPPAYYADRLCERGRAYLSQLYDPARTRDEDEDVPNNPAALLALRQQQQNAINVHADLAETMFYV